MSAEKGHRNTAEALIKNRANVNIRAMDGSSPVEAAAKNGIY